MKKFLYVVVAFVMILQTGFLSAIPAHAEGDVTETPTPEPSSTPAPTETDIPTPTPVPTETPIQVETEPIIPEEITLSLTSDPPYIKRGGELYLEWNIGGLKEITKGTLLRFYLPKGLKLIDPMIGTLNEEGGILDIEIIELIGKVGFIAGEEVETPLVITAEFLQEEKSLAQAALSLLEPSETLIESTGGTADGLAGTIKVTFPEGALSETVKVSIEKPTKESLPVKSLSGMPFEITAFSEVSKAEVSNFSTPVEIQVAYSEAGLIDESDLRLYWYDPKDGQWKLPLSQRVDTENNILYGYTDHFTVFDTYNSNWQTALTPTMSGFQTSGFTGSASFSMPIKVPAGPGGFAPSLTLSYSSSVVDNAGSRTQASWAGMGWSLTTSYIERNGHGTNGVQDDSYNLNLNGTSVELFPGTDGKYHASDENFYKFELTGTGTDTTWTVWDKTGNVYVFDHRTNYLHEQPCDNGYEITPYVWRWSLSTVTNIHGEVMNYSYYEDTKLINYTACGGNPTSVVASTWVYPSEIKYSNNRYRIAFYRVARTDYESLWASQYSFYTAYQKSLLRWVKVEQDADGDGIFETSVRKYLFSYASAGAGIFPDYQWEAGGYTPTLASVKEYGTIGTQSLPYYSFAYDDMHLVTATNGYGGTATYQYDNWTQEIPYAAWGTLPIPDHMAPAWGSPFKHHFATNTEGWTRTDPLTSLVTYNAGGGGSISIWGLVQNLDTNKTVNSFQPGRWYMFIASAKADDSSGTHDVRFGFRYKQGGVYKNAWGDVIPLTTTFQTVSSGLVFLPADATAFAPRILSTGMNRLNWYYIYPLKTAYRVTSRTLSTTGASYTFGYDYTGAALNTPTNLIFMSGNSEAATGPHPYIPPFSEFRGHSQVIETDPYGSETITTYFQDDDFNGRTDTVTTKSAAGKILQTSQSDYLVTPWFANLTLIDQDTRNPLLYNTPFDQLKYRWVRTDTESRDVYQITPQNISVASLLTEYEYNATYGNMTQKTVSGAGIDTTITHYNYTINVTGGKWLTGLLSRTYVKDINNNTLSLSMNLYDDHQLYSEQPDEGILTGRRTWVGGTQYSQTGMGYDTYGNVTSQTVWTEYGPANGTPPGGAQTTYTCYGSAEYLGDKWCPNNVYHTYALWTKNAKGHITNVDYSGIAVPGTIYTGYTLGLPVSETDPNGAVTSATYDEYGRFTSLTKPGETTPSLNVSYVNSPFKVTLEQTIQGTQKFKLVRNYDGLGRQTSTVTDNTIMVTSTFDAYGRALTQSTPYAGTETAYYSTTTYDALGRPLTMTAPDGTATSYDYNGLYSTVTDGKGNKTTTETNILGWTLSVTPKDSSGLPFGPNVDYEYDELGNLTFVSRGGADLTLTYDKAGRKTSMADPDMGNWGYTYDALGNMLTQTDARGCVTTLQYDTLNRLTNKSYSNCPSGVAATPNVQYYYDGQTFSFDNDTYGSSPYPLGRRTGVVVTGTNAAAWTYDERGRVASETRIFPFVSDLTTVWTYNSADLPETMIYPGGEEVTTTYNSRMQPVSIIGDAGYVTSMVYDSAGRMTSRALGNGLTQSYGYYDWNEQVGDNGQGGRLETLVTGTLQNLTYIYDKVGNISRITNNTAGEISDYGYDALDRLTTWTMSNTTETYDYDDDTGNLVDKNGLLLDYPDANGSDPVHPHAVTSAGTNTYSYDNNGNQTTRTFGSDHFDLNYDAESRLVEVQKNDVIIAEFEYDSDGQRVESDIDNEVVYFVGGYYELNDTTDEVTKYYLAGAGRIAMRKYTVPESIELEYFLGDHLGSTSITTDTNGVKVSEMRYKPWGELRFSLTNPPENTTPIFKLTRYQYTGQYSYDLEFGLKYYGARFYDSATGHFVSSDTKIPSGGNGQEWDRYAYSFNNPIKYSDPTGHDPVIDFLLGMSQGLSTSLLWWDVPLVQSAVLTGKESDAQLVGRLVGDVVAAVAGIAGTIGGLGAAGGGGVYCAVTLGGGCILGGGGLVVAGAAIAAEGATAALAAGADIGTTAAVMSKRGSGDGGRPGSNQAQNKQFDGAVKELEEQLGRELNPDEISQLHEAIHHLEDPGYWDIVDEGLNLFEPSTGSTITDSE